MEPVIGSIAVESLDAWIKDHASDPEAGSAKTLLRKAKALASGKPLPVPKPPDFEPFVARLVAEGKKAAKTFRRAHPGAKVCSFAFDADPHEEFFAACFDDTLRPNARDEAEVGNYRWHLFHEFGLPVLKKLPRGAPPPSPSVKDGCVEHYFRPVLERACQELAACGAFDGRALQKPFTIGYAYQGEELIKCATVTDA